MSDSQYKPPAHPLLKFDGNNIALVDERKNGFLINCEEAISLGLALMETGLYLKAQRKSQQPGGTNA